jgi:transcriptional regulator with XRE-family HTH domain
MSIFSENIRYLRAQKQLSQQKLADQLEITRSRLSKYEDGLSEPPLDLLRKISGYYHISIDLLISTDVRKIDYENLLTLADNRIVLPITIDKNGNDNIEIIPLKAKAGYLQGYGDPEFIENLESMTLPFVSKGKCRAFPIEGDSMLPLKNGSFVVGKYIESLDLIKDGKTYIVVSVSEGIVYKRVYRKNKKSTSFLLHSDNDFYKPFELRTAEILEVWEFVCSLTTVEYQPNDLKQENIQEMFLTLRSEIGEIREKLEKK